jgi:outer membrane usher protein
VKRTSAYWNWIVSAVMLALIVPDASSQTGPSSLPGIESRDLPGIGVSDLGLPSPASRSPMPLYLEVILNQTRLPEPVAFAQRDNRLFAMAAVLRGLGLRVPDHLDDELVALDTLPGVDIRYEAAAQRVVINVPLSGFDLTTTPLGPAETASPTITDSAPGMLLNYDLYASDSEGSRSVAATSELRVFGLGRGVLSNTTVARGYRIDDGWHHESVRLDTRWELSFPRQAVTLTLGDTYTGFLDWTRPLRIGGIQIGRNYALQPYRITAPLPEFLGEATVPSEVELYVNGVRQYDGNAPTGPFRLSTVPGLTGAGIARMVVTDAFGQVRTLDFPFYSTQRLLARGLSDWSFGLGMVREDYGIRSFSYGNAPVASATLRYGVGNRFTFEGHAEGGDGLANAGIGGVWLLGIAGVLNLSHTRSSVDGNHGSQTSMGYGWNNQRFNFSAESRRTHGDYRDLASLYGSRPPPRSDRALAGVNFATLGSLSLSYVRLDSADPDIAPARLAGLYWNRSFAGRWSASLSVNRNLDDADDYSAYLGVAIPLGRERQLGLSWQRDRDRDNAVLDLVQPVPGDGGFGWRLQGRGGDDGNGGLAEVGWLGQHARVGAGMMRWDDFDYGYAQASGSLVWMGGSAFAARSIQDAFAVVSTDGMPGIPVMLENRVIGRTGANGKLLVTPLNAWQRNKLSIDPMDLPANVRVAAVDRIVAPSDRAGVGVAFGLTPVRAALLVLHDTQGRPLPLGSRVHLNDSPAKAVIGHDGETYLEGLQVHNRIRVELSGTTCMATFDYPEAIADGIARIGPLICAGTAP